MLREGEGVLVLLHAGERRFQHFIEPVTLKAIGRAIEPPGLERLLKDVVAAYQALESPSGLAVELRTDRCVEGAPVVYRFGEQPRLLVRANQECTLRLIYSMSDGRRLLLLDRHPLGAHQVNQWVRLPLELEACAPAGTEQLILQAATNAGDARLPEMRVENMDMGGGWFMPVIVEPLAEAMTRTRGVMQRQPELYAQSVSQWTVFEK